MCRLKQLAFAASEPISIKKKHASTGTFHHLFCIHAVAFCGSVFCSLRQQQQQEEFESLRKLESLSHALDCRIYEYEERFAALKLREELARSRELLLEKCEQRFSDHERETERSMERAAEEARNEQCRLQADLLKLQRHLEERQQHLELIEQNLCVHSEIEHPQLHSLASAKFRHVLPSPQSSPYAAEQAADTVLDLGTQNIELGSSSTQPNHPSPIAASLGSRLSFSSPYPVINNVLVGSHLYPNSVTATAAFLDPSLVQIPHFSIASQSLSTPSRRVMSQLPLDSFLSPQRNDVGDLFTFAASPAMTPNTFGKAIRSHIA